jgi:dolichyl-diphosphooligosaccharide--protein glycosyltransferase
MAQESKPLWSDPAWARELLGSLLLLGPLAVAGAVVAARKDRRLIAALVPLALFLPAAGKQARLMFPALGCLALVLWPGLKALFDAFAGDVPGRRKTIAVAYLGISLATLALQLTPGEPGPGLARHLQPALEWMRTHTPPASSGPYAPEKPAWGVLSNHLAGHFILLWAERPVVATTFGQTKWHREANDTAMKILSDPDVPHALAAARALGIRYLLVYRHMPLLGASDEAADKSMAHQLANGLMPGGVMLRYDADGVRIIELTSPP